MDVGVYTHKASMGQLPEQMFREAAVCTASDLPGQDPIVKKEQNLPRWQQLSTGSLQQSLQGSPREPPGTGEPGPDLGGLESPGVTPGKHHSPSCPLGPQQTCRSRCRKQAGHLSQLCLKSISFLKEGLESPRKGPQSWQEVTDSCFLQSTKRKFKL